jgi:spore coat polysaccharide biosynthesis protein SpsF
MKTAITITARMKSIRLPRKVMLEIHGTPMIIHLIRRLKLAQRPDTIIMCTSTNPQDDILVDVACQEGIDFFRGSEDDVLDRLSNACRALDVDLISSCTADNPFVDPIYIDRLLEYHTEQGNDYTRVEGLPFGTFTYAVGYPALVKACEIKAAQDTEVWGGYFTQTGQFTTGVLQVTDPAVRRPDLRLTVDTPEDFELIRRIFDELCGQGRIFPLAEIVDLLDGRPALRSINAQVQQKAAKPIRLKAHLGIASEE